MTRQNQYSHHYFLTAGESDAEGFMSPALMAERVIEVATEHANLLGIGYDALIQKGIGWVLSRLSVEMVRYPHLNEHYTLTTWIEAYNRHFSERNFVITTPSGETLGYVRTVWAAMDFRSRTIADLTALEREAFPIGNLECPIAKAPRIAALDSQAQRRSYTFSYCDLDFNRHVNTVRYIELLLNSWSLDHFDASFAGRYDIIFHHECRYGESVEIGVGTADADGRQICEIIGADGSRAITAAFTWKPLPQRRDSAADTGC